MKRVLFWLLSIANVFALRLILQYYNSLGITIPRSHARAGLVEGLIGYLSAGFVIGKFIVLVNAFLIALAVLAVLGSIDLYAMSKCVRPWKYFKGKEIKSVAKIFMLEGHNVVWYYLFGAALAAVL